MMDVKIRNRIVVIATDCAVEAVKEAVKFTAEPSEDGKSIKVKTMSGEVIEILEPHIRFNLHGFDHYFVNLFRQALDEEYPVV